LSPIGVLLCYDTQANGKKFGKLVLQRNVRQLALLFTAFVAKNACEKLCFVALSSQNVVRNSDIAL
jgi:hypothetical protein